MSPMPTWPSGVKLAEALSFKCPKCGAEPGTGCVYIWPTHMPRYPEPPEGYWSKTYRETAAREGQPTKRPHNDRLTAAWHKQRRQRRKQRTAELSRIGYTPEVLATIRAGRQYDSREFVQLRDWILGGGGRLLSYAASAVKGQALDVHESSEARERDAGGWS